MKCLRIALTGFWALIIIGFAQAAIIRVPGDYPTIQAGMDAAADGDTVLVADGTYTGDGNRDLDFKGKWITVTSENGAVSTIIDCERNGRGFYFHSGESSESVVSGLTIKNGSPDDAYRGAICCVHSSSPKIENNIITDNQGGGIYCNLKSSPTIRSNLITANSADIQGGAICCNEHSSPTIQGNEITANRAGRGGAIYYHGTSLIIVGNVISHNSSNGRGGAIYGDFGDPSHLINNIVSCNSAGTWGGAFFATRSSTITMIHNVIVGNVAGDQGGGIYLQESVCHLLNSILRGSKPVQIYFDSFAWIDITYSDIQGGWPGEGNIDTDPFFVDVAKGDYHLRNDSPCIGAGLMTPDVPDTDIEGNPRPNPPDSRPDMGAYENPLGGAARTSTMYIETGQSINRGGLFSAAVSVEDMTDLAGFQFDISFDPAILEALQIEEGTFLSDSDGTYCIESDIDNDAGVITYVACAKTSKGGADGSGTLAVVEFKAIGAGESYIRLQNIAPSDSSGSIIPVTSLDGNVTVIEFPAWDVNKDGRVDILDLVLVGQHFGDDITAPMDPNPDVNGDGTVNILDLVLVGQHFGQTYPPMAPPRDM